MQRSSAIETAAEPRAAESAGNDEGLGRKFAEGLGRKFAEGLGRKDFDAVLDLLDPEIDFRGLTPGRVWQASDSSRVVDEVLRQWFEDGDKLEEIVSIETDSFADRQRVAYRFCGRNQDGPFIVEQQAYYTATDGRINWMRVLCSGFRPH